MTLSLCTQNETFYLGNAEEQATSYVHAIPTHPSSL